MITKSINKVGYRTVASNSYGSRVVARPKPKWSRLESATEGGGQQGPFGLTLMEMRVIELLPRGLTNREIGTELGISEETVKVHVRSLKQKLGARHRAEVAAIAQRKGLA